MRKRSKSEVFRITGARQGLEDDVRGRQRRYVISMGVRTLSFVLAACLWNVSRYVAVVALVLGMVLPYIAVVIANAGRESSPGLPSTFVATPPVERAGIGPAPERAADEAQPEPGRGPETEPEAEERPVSEAGANLRKSSEE
ncbi:hypothetical protein BJP40_28530 [Streptomyces sp. CC53]|uniref:DUF3099 domain-containing protein n=1 Tax=unclassified Streptomyces TaxID=2593676 RepID=UPI0008DD1649|nr:MULTISPECIES: DUF3099 domain-containing protein [unclassified Streptomyces]OII62326.1 hypothetical protein BJP40_28530 [Streptomyces sp. CC53]